MLIRPAPPVNARMVDARAAILRTVILSAAKDLLCTPTCAPKWAGFFASLRMTVEWAPCSAVDPKPVYPKADA